MTASATIAHILDPLIDPRFAKQDLQYDKAFSSNDDHVVTRDYVRGYKRNHVDSLDWAGDKLLMACKDGNLRLWDPDRAEKERSWPGDWMSVQCDPNSPHTAASVAWDGKFRVFDTRSSNSSTFDVDLKRTSASMREFLFLCWSPDSKYIAVANRQDQVYVLDLRSSGTLALGAHKNLQHEINQMAWSQDGTSLWLATGGTPGKLQVFPAPALNASEGAAVVAHQYAAISLAVDPQGRHIACGGGDCLVTLWDPRHLVCKGSYGYATQAVTTVGFNHTGNLLAWGTGNAGSSGGEKNLTIVGTDTGTLYWQDTTPAPVQQVRWHPKKNLLAYTLNATQLPEERDVLGRDRRGSGRDTAVVHTLKVPEIA